jgi:protein SCO1/2
VAGSRLRTVATVLATLLLAAGCASGESASGHQHQGMSGTEVKNPFDVPDTPLTDTDGAAYSLAGDTDKPLTLLFFGYTHCPDVCQMVMANITSALARLDEPDRAQVDVVFVTTDPARDDGRTLRSYLQRFGDGMVGLTGDLDTIVGVGKAFGVYLEREQELPTGGYDVSHTTNVFAIDADDQAPMTWDAQTSPAALAADITTFLDEE